MAIDTHIKFTGVDGEATHKDHKGEIEVLSWGWGVVNQSQTVGGGSGKGKAEPMAFHLTKLYCKASPVMAKKCAQGVHFDTVTMTCRKSGEGQKDFLKVTMKEAYITSISPSGSSGGDIIESVQMTYGWIDFDYKAQDEKGGMGGGVLFKWDVKKSDFP
ncbi:MAG: type VI secretion system tube protein Hcp [Rubrivivax sp.]|nr:type VI secretion system tube protein Hcp [Rubrivivax sp.]